MITRKYQIYMKKWHIRPQNFKSFKAYILGEFKTFAHLYKEVTPLSVYHVLAKRNYMAMSNYNYSRIFWINI